jgi:hypothetical protein
LKFYHAEHRLKYIDITISKIVQYIEVGAGISKEYLEQCLISVESDSRKKESAVSFG